MTPHTEQAARDNPETVAAAHCSSSNASGYRVTLEPVVT
jgi:hypothetical protein